MSRSARNRQAFSASLIWVLGLAVGIAIGVLSIYLLATYTGTGVDVASVEG